MKYTIGERIIHTITKTGTEGFVIYKYKSDNTYRGGGEVWFDANGKVDLHMNELYDSYLENNNLENTLYNWFKEFTLEIYDKSDTLLESFTDEVMNVNKQWFDNYDYNIDTTFAHISNYHTQPYIQGMKLNLLAFDDWSHWTTKNRKGDVYVAYNRSNPMIFATEIAREHLGSSMVVSNLKSPKLYFDKLYDTLTLICNGEDTNLGDDFGVGFVYEDDTVQEWADMSTSIGDVIMTKTIHNGMKIKGLLFNFHTGGTENAVLNKLNVFIGNSVGDSVVVKDPTSYTFSTGVHIIDTTSMNIDNICDYKSVSYMINYPTDEIEDSNDRERRIVNQTYEIDRMNIDYNYKLTWIGRDNLVYQFPFSGRNINSVKYESKYTYNRYNEKNKYQTNVTNTWELNTQLITNEDIILLESLNNSLDIKLHSFKYNKTIPVNMVGDIYKYKTFDNEHKPFGLTVNIEEKETHKIR